MRDANPAAGGSTQRRGTVLLVGNYHPSLAVARALSASGYRVVAGDGGEYAVVGRSRSCAGVWRHPPAQQPEAFLDALLGLLERRPRISVVMPLRPPYVALLAAERDRLPSRVAVASPPPDVVRTCLDKARMHALAVDAGIPMRPMVVARDIAELLAAARETGFPCIVRPTQDSGQPLPANRKAIICSDAAALEEAFATWPAGQPSLLVQRYLVGPRHNVYFAARDGRILARIESRIERTDRLDGTGLNVQAVTVPDDPRVVRGCDALVERLGYTGVGLAQFLMPADGGEPHFLEINPRHGAGVVFMQGCGLDLVTASVELARADGAWDVPPGIAYPVGRRYAWTSRDLFGLLMARSRREAGGRETLRWLGRLAWAAIRADVHGTWSLRDPMPTVAVYAHLVGHRLRRPTGVADA